MVLSKVDKVAKLGQTPNVLSTIHSKIDTLPKESLVANISLSILKDPQFASRRKIINYHDYLTFRHDKICQGTLNAPVACMFTRNDVFECRKCARSSSFVSSNSDGSAKSLSSSLVVSVFFIFTFRDDAFAGPTRTNLSAKKTRTSPPKILSDHLE